jgi:hypothetical protein
MIRFPDAFHPQFEKLCERLRAFRESIAAMRRTAYAGLAKQFSLEEGGNRLYRRSNFRRRRPVKRSVW